VVADDFISLSFEDFKPEVGLSVFEEDFPDDLNDLWAWICCSRNWEQKKWRMKS
jgi:hypothetical protein